MGKKDDKNYETVKMLETLIIIAFMSAAIITVFKAFFDQITEDEGEYEDYTYVDYSYDSYEDSYDEYGDYYMNSNNNIENTSVSNFSSIEEFMNSEEGKAFLDKANLNIENYEY